ncbi:MAG TPA: hypothetical protein PKA41_14345 [Verrucomicrobiota bacterium]|nr:hypothetical protein [Verrucomicrobiota bacterium]
MNTKIRLTIIRSCIFIVFFAAKSQLFELRAQGNFTPGPPNIVQNGSFETTASPGDTAIHSYEEVVPPSWTGFCGSELGFEQAADGQNFVALRYNGYFITQTLTTIPGQLYRISFAVAGYSGFPQMAIMEMKWGGSVAGIVPWTSPNTTGNGLNYNWVYGSFDVIAVSSSTELMVRQSASSTALVTYLDAVQVIPIPEPSTWIFLLCFSAVLTSFHRPGCQILR